MKETYHTRRRYLWGLSLVCLAFAVADGLKFIPFEADAATVGLLIIAAFPLIKDFISTIKAGGVEVNFKALSVQQQIFVFLDSMAARHQWTFYSSIRPGESNLGQGFGFLVRDLQKRNEHELREQIEEWFSSESDNKKWFAAEIVGYLRMDDCKERLPEFYAGMDPNETWEPWQLNCLWAHSRFNGYKELVDMLNGTTNLSNQLWIVDALNQMVIAKEDDHEYAARALRTFAERNDVSDQVRASALKTFEPFSNSV